MVWTLYHPMLNHVYICLRFPIGYHHLMYELETSTISSSQMKEISITCLLGDGSVAASGTSFIEFWSYIQDSVSEIKLLQLETRLKAWSMSEFLAELVAVFSLPRSRDWPLEWLVSLKLGFVLRSALFILERAWNRCVAREDECKPAYDETEADSVYIQKW